VHGRYYLALDAFRAATRRDAADGDQRLTAIGLVGNGGKSPSSAAESQCDRRVRQIERGLGREDNCHGDGDGVPLYDGDSATLDSGRTDRVQRLAFNACFVFNWRYVSAVPLVLAAVALAIA
jgi:hypothetical protein